MGAAPLSSSVGCADPISESRVSSRSDSKASIFDAYEIGGLLGSGSFGQVRLCWPQSSQDGRKFAVKVVDTKGAVYAHASSFISARQEANILKTVRHPHIVELVDVFEKERWLFLVMECVPGGELFSALADPKVTVNEGCIASVGRQLFQALRHLHDQMIVHRDVKAENILLLTNPAKTSRWHIKLIDFGLATRMEQQSPCLFQLCREQEVPLEELICGTAYYCAPEVWVNDYNPKVDVWAAGVVLYLALHGAFPFYSGDSNALEALICDPESQPSFQPVCKKDCPGYEVSPEARQGLVAMLEKDQDNRPTAAAVLSQPWLQETKRCGSLALVPRPRIGSASKRTTPLRANSVGCGGDFLAGLDRPVPVAVRMKAGRAAASPPVEAEKEESRTAALEALKVRTGLNSPRSCKANLDSPGQTQSFLWRSPRVSSVGVDSRDLEVGGKEVKSKSAHLALSWLEHDVADASLTDSDTEEGHVHCVCR